MRRSGAVKVIPPRCLPRSPVGFNCVDVRWRSDRHNSIKWRRNGRAADIVGVVGVVGAPGWAELPARPQASAAAAAMSPRVPGEMRRSAIADDLLPARCSSASAFARRPHTVAECFGRRCPDVIRPPLCRSRACVLHSLASALRTPVVPACQVGLPQERNFTTAPGRGPPRSGSGSGGSASCSGMFSRQGRPKRGRQTAPPGAALMSASGPRLRTAQACSPWGGGCR